MKTSDFDYHLPPELIAQTPIEPRDHSRLLVLDRRSGAIEHRHFYDIVEYLQSGDVLLCNDSRVIPARLYGRRAETGGVVEVLLLRRLEAGVWEALVKPGKSLRTGAKIDITAQPGQAGLQGEVVGMGENGTRVLRFSDESMLRRLGRVPLPPYIHTPLPTPERYQTVYACAEGSAAAPTAGLHFTPELIARLKQKGVRCLFATLHIGLDTFSPVSEDDPQQHVIHKEYGILSQAVADELNQAKKEGRRIIGAGTTATRIAEQAAQAGVVEALEGWVSLFILPGYQFRAIDALITNFHLPRSTLLMLVSAFAGKGLIEKAYREAITARYRFYSFGDAMLIV